MCQRPKHDYTRKRDVPWCSLCVSFPFSQLPNNMSNDTVKDTLGISTGLQVGVTLFAIIIILASLFGNIVVIYIVSTATYMRNSMNILIANMAVADLLMAIDLLYIVKWLFVYDKWFGTFVGSALCKFFHGAQNMSVVASVFSLVAISLDRALAILLPMKTIFTRNVVRLCIALSWLGALAFALPLMIATSVVDVGHMSCNEEPASWLGMSKEAYFVAFTVLTYAIPLLLIAIIYVVAGVKLWSRKPPGQSIHEESKASSKRATFMLITVVVVFALSWLPFHVREMIAIFSPETLIPLELYVFIPFLGYANSAVNPMLYVIFSENYRREFNRVLCGGQSRKDRYKNTVITHSTSRLTRLSTVSSANPTPLQKLLDTGDANPSAQEPHSPDSSTRL